MQVTLDTTLVLCRKVRQIVSHKKAQKIFLCFCAFLWLKVDDAAAHADRDGLGAIGRAELFHDVFDVNFNCLF